MKTVYYLEGAETDVIVNYLQGRGGIFSTVQYHRFGLCSLYRLKTVGMSGVFHAEQGDIPDYSVLIWGSGEEHDVSLIMTPQVDYVKSVDDAHSDYSDPVTTRLTGVNECVHNSAFLLNYPKAKFVEVIGGFDTFFDRIEAGPTQEVKYYVQHRGPSRFSGRVVHKSIDLDVVPDFPARYDWQNNPGASLSVDKLQQNLELLCDANRVVRFDLGGLHFPRPHELEHYGGKINPLNDHTALQRALDAHAALIETYLRKTN